MPPPRHSNVSLIFGDGRAQEEEEEERRKGEGEQRSGRQIMARRRRASHISFGTLWRTAVNGWVAAARTRHKTYI